MRKWEKLETHTQIDKKQFQTILDFCLRDNNYFSYNNTIYQQIYGMPMGNPLSPTIANIVLDKILDDSLAELKSKDIYVKYITKYVDDIFAIVKAKDVEDILTVFNAQHTRIQFTKELEQNNKIAFLDVEIHRKNQNLTFNWYAKSMASGRIINYHSNHPWKQKINTATSLIRKIHLLSDGDFIEENKKKIKNILFKNSYPNTLIEKLIINTTQEMDHPNSSNGQTEANTNKTYIGVTYIPGLTSNQSLRRIMKKDNITFAHKPHNTLNRFFTKTKDKIDKGQQCNVVYKIQCNGNNNNACNKCYIGTTKRALRTRIHEHEMDAKNRKTNTALSQHLTDNGHTADFGNAKILDVERRCKRRMTLESLRIQQHMTNVMNFKEDIDNTNSAYTAIIKNDKNKNRK
ncbi:uncharacterized protein [Eurosta solidaginis]